MMEAYIWTTPNGFKLTIALEELGLPYKLHFVNIGKGDQFKPEFLAVNPNNKIPALIDPNGPDGKPVTVFESGAILLYLAEKTKKLIPQDAHGRYAVIQWLFWQNAGLGPMFGQYFHFKGAPEKIPYAIERYQKESARLLGVLDKQLATNQYVAGDEFSIADITIIGWLRNGYEGLGQTAGAFPNIDRWIKLILSRPAVAAGLAVKPPQ
mmetsp:Transcript_36335/g.58742  ORF Transcript_36335/g.58742 Transcript_36335/m.58742 type:complete len:209 (-) Transcript_36335:504-1130(-)|eukprot:CAMPEP_0184655956 /NCGR_PEP_ID=MMETSP0308-20130426/15046_1 /TAXON_ID=38269 /ORGANISM="Gloeochaete witrockiana, Strain SAG 46.84" /LENGTH=208 /DNA_ID=CAMNT_0027092799 /DNA_START=276 /DNA_END=902 /DNA_ORIENTATION=-